VRSQNQDRGEWDLRENKFGLNPWSRTVQRKLQEELLAPEHVCARRQAEPGAGGISKEKPNKTNCVVQQLDMI
jgi:hypothetical protein